MVQIPLHDGGQFPSSGFSQSLHQVAEHDTLLRGQLLNHRLENGSGEGGFEGADSGSPDLRILVRQGRKEEGAALRAPDLLRCEHDPYSLFQGAGLEHLVI